jgi:Patatin-like phospholipase
MDATTPNVRDYTSQGWRPAGCDRVALVLQGGGALGAYQAGVYQALQEADVEPDWVSGVSIGAINSAIIAGNSRRRRLDRLRTFWEMITERKLHARRRRLPQGPQRRQLLDDDDAGPARLLHSTHAEPVAQPARCAERDELLRHRAASRHAGRPRRFLDDQTRSRSASRSAPSTCSAATSSISTTPPRSSGRST